MSLFTKRRKISRKNKEERINRLNEGCIKIEKSMKKMIQVMEAILKDHPEYEELSEEERMKIYTKYYQKYGE